MLRLTGYTCLLRGWDIIRLSKFVLENYMMEGGGIREVGGLMESFPSRSWVTQFPERLCRGNSPGLLGPPLDSRLHEGWVSMC